MSYFPSFEDINPQGGYSYDGDFQVPDLGFFEHLDEPDQRDFQELPLVPVFPCEEATDITPLSTLEDKDFSWMDFLSAPVDPSTERTQKQDDDLSTFAVVDTPPSSPPRAPTWGDFLKSAEKVSDVMRTTTTITATPQPREVIDSTAPDVMRTTTTTTATPPPPASFVPAPPPPQFFVVDVKATPPNTHPVLDHTTAVPVQNTKKSAAIPNTFVWRNSFIPSIPRKYSKRPPKPTQSRGISNDVKKRIKMRKIQENNKDKLQLAIQKEIQKRLHDKSA